MNRSFHSFLVVLLAAAIPVVGIARPARAQAPQNDLGVRLSESSVLHLNVTEEGGYDTNVFYNDDNRTQSAFMRTVLSLLMTNAGRSGESPSLLYTLGASGVYREYINDDSNVRAQRAFNPTFFGSLSTGTGQGFGAVLAEQFTRVQDPGYAAVPATDPNAGAPTPTVPDPNAVPQNSEAIQIVRDTNLASLTLRFAPGGGRIVTSLRYSNLLDYYETPSYEASSNMAHGAMLDLGWKWLPKTALYLQFASGYIQYLNSSPNHHNSIPLQAMTGLRGLLTPKVTMGLGAGYSTAIYSDGAAGPSGLSNLAVTADLGYAPTVLTKIGLGYMHGFRNSAVLGDFYDVDSFNVTLGESLGRLVASGYGRYEYRRYHGLRVNSPDPAMMATTAEVPRRDHLLIAGLGLDYFFRKWLFGGIAYSITFDRANADELGPAFRATARGYTKQQVFARIGFSY